MSKEPLLLLGAGGHGRACIDVIEQEGRFVIAGFVGIAAEVGRDVYGYSVLGDDDDGLALLRKFSNAIVTIGQIKSPAVRMRLFDLVERSGATPRTVVSPLAYVSPHASIGAGTIVMHGAIVNAGAVVGRNCILNSRSLIEHDAVIQDHCHIATAAVVNGGARIGAGTFLGSGSIVRESVTVGDRSVIGMGSTILGDCAPDTHGRPPVKPSAK